MYKPWPAWQNTWMGGLVPRWNLLKWCLWLCSPIALVLYHRQHTVSVMLITCTCTFVYFIATLNTTRYMFLLSSYFVGCFIIWILSIFALFDIFQHLSKEGVVAVLTFTDERFNYKPQTPGQENEQLSDHKTSTLLWNTAKCTYNIL